MPYTSTTLRLPCWRTSVALDPNLVGEPCGFSWTLEEDSVVVASGSFDLADLPVMATTPASADELMSVPLSLTFTEGKIYVISLECAVGGSFGTGLQVLSRGAIGTITSEYAAIDSPGYWFRLEGNSGNLWECATFNGSNAVVSQVGSTGSKTFYADSSTNPMVCAFVFSTAPLAVPYGPTPSDTEEDIDIYTETLTWLCDDTPDYYKVYFGTELEGANLQGTVTTEVWPIDVSPATHLDPGVTYVWKIVAVYGEEEASSPTWSFDTKPLTYYLGKATTPSPEHEFIGTPIRSSSLGWTAGTGATSQDVYFREGTSGDFTKVLADSVATDYSLPLLKYSTTYQWYVVSKNSLGEVTGDTWTFTAYVLDIGVDGAVTGAIRRRLVAAANNALWVEDD